MAERKRIALNYRVGYDFSAGIVIYIQNLIRSFHLLPDSLRPELTIIYSDESPVDEVKALGYPYIRYYHYKPLSPNLLNRATNKLSRMVLKKNLVRRYSFPRDIDILFPFFDCLETYDIRNKFYWKPDFQEMYYPQYFSQAEYDYSFQYMKNIAADKAATLILSSRDAENDFHKFFSPSSISVRVLPFLSLLPDLRAYDAAVILKKYHLPGKYFMVANQFWPHKNHLLVLEAIQQLKQEVTGFRVVISGKQSSYRDKEYFSRLKKYIEQNQLEEFVLFTGFIPREEQLVLMKNSLAVIQPSLFEGWSTVIEDCKALNHFVLAADLAVNHEQLDKNCRFFNRHSSAMLAGEMKSLLLTPVSCEPHDYQVRIDRFLKNLCSIFSIQSPSV